MSAWEDAQEQHRGAALLAGAEAELLGEDPMVAADLRALAEPLRLCEVARDYVPVIRARVDGEETFGYGPADLHQAAIHCRMVSTATSQTPFDGSPSGGPTKEEETFDRPGVRRAVSRHYGRGFSVGVRLEPGQAAPALSGETARTRKLRHASSTACCRLRLSLLRREDDD